MFLSETRRRAAPHRAGSIPSSAAAVPAPGDRFVDRGTVSRYENWAIFLAGKKLRTRVLRLLKSTSTSET